VQVVATKADKVKATKRDRRRAEVADGVGQADVLWVSAAKGSNIDQLRSRLRTWVEPDGSVPGTI